MRFLILFAATAIGMSASDSALAKDDGQLWTTANASVRIDDRWKVAQEVTARFSDNRNGLYEIESVTMLSYRIGKAVTVGAGYVHDPLYAQGDFTVLEQRAREQVSVDNFAHIGRGKLSARLRLEQRWRENSDGTAWRMRPYIRYSLPLTASGKTALNLSNETFVNLKNTAFQRATGVDRMRNLVSISTPLSKKLTIELGYLNQYGFVDHGPDTIDHVASTSISLNL